MELVKKAKASHFFKACQVLTAKYLSQKQKNRTNAGFKFFE